jgi:hypothetical protein
MTSDPTRPEGHPENRDPGPEGRGDPPDPARTLELLQALARQQQPPPTAPAHPPDSAPQEHSPLDELARLLGQHSQPPAPPVRHEEAPQDADFADLFEPADSPPPLPRRPRRRFGALLPSRRAMLAMGALLAIAVAAAGAASVWWSQNRAPAPETASADALAKAMAECDVEAAKNPDTLNFLVIPLTPGASNNQTSPPTQAGESYLLLSAQDALNGLRNGSLMPYAGQYAFSIVEPATGTRHSWPPTTGPTKFAEPDAGNLTSIKLGFAFTDVASAPKLSSEFLRQKGNCYWVSVLVR